MKKMNKKGFTIVELVIVIAVIAILSAVLIPTFSGVVAEANNTAAVTDAKTAYQEYVAATTLAGGTAELNMIFVAAESSEGKADGRYVVIKNGQVYEKTEGDTKVSVFTTETAALAELKGVVTEGKDTVKGSAVEGNSKLFTVKAAA